MGFTGSDITDLFRRDFRIAFIFVFLMFWRRVVEAVGCGRKLITTWDGIFGFLSRQFLAHDRPEQTSWKAAEAMVLLRERGRTCF